MCLRNKCTDSTLITDKFLLSFKTQIAYNLLTNHTMLHLKEMDRFHLKNPS